MTSPRALLRSGAFAMVFALAAVAGRWTVVEGSVINLVWPAAGIGAAWLLLQRRRPTFVLDGALLAAVVAVVDLATGTGPVAAVALAAVNLGQALLFVAVFERLARPDRGLGPVLLGTRDLTALLVAAGFSTTVGAVAGSTVLALVHSEASLLGVLVWQMRNGAAVLVVVGVALRARQLLLQRRGTAHPELLPFRVPRGWRAAELVAAVVVSVLAHVAVFGWLPEYPVAFPLLALTAWVALRFDTALTVLRTAVTSVVAVLFTLAGHGPFALVDDVLVRAGIVQAFVAIAAALGLALAVNRDERLVLVQQLRDSVHYADERHRQVRVLAEASRSVLLADDPRHAVCAAVREAVGADGAWLIEPDGEGFLVSTAVDGDGVPAVRVPMDPSTSLTAAMFADGRPRFVCEAGAEPGLHQGFVTEHGVASAAWQPAALGEDHVVAVIAVFWRTPVDVFCETTRGVLTVLGGEAARAIERGNLLEQLARAADRDQLTGLANRRRWDELSVVEVSRAQRSGAPLSFLLLDLDHFKVFNDTRGHQAGDVLLQEFAAAAAGCLREGDLLARWGGEEFAVALPDCPASEALQVAERIIAAVPGGQSATVGVAQWIPGETGADVLGRADAALYDGKRAGRARAVLAGQPLFV